MRKRTKAIVAITVSAFCVALSASVAYGAIQSVEENDNQIVIDADATPMDVEEDVSESDSSPLKEMKLCEHDVDESTSAAASAAEQRSNADSTASVPSMVVDGVDYRSDAMANAQALAPCTLSMLGHTISYVNAYNVADAPLSTAGLWAGADSTTDGSWAYFVGHHPGVFDCVMDLHNGDAVQVCDGNGNTRTYHVISIYDIPDYTQWEQIAPDVESHGESITLQTCCGDNQHYRIIEAV